MIVVAHELSPGLTVQLDREHVVGLISEEGTRTSHAAILAHSLGIPTVMGVTGALAKIPEGTLVLIDGQAGVITVDPTAVELEEAKVQISRRHRLEFQLESVVALPAETPDGVRVSMMGNVDLPDEIESAMRSGAEGVGLLRTEFLLTGRAALPTEAEQYAYFKRVSLAFPNSPVIIRSYDLGGDKFPAAFRMPQEANPFLGWRSIRVCLDQPEVFRTQLRAMLRAAADRNVQLMLPLVTRVDEVTDTRALLEEERAVARQRRLPRGGATSRRRDDRDAGGGAHRRQAGRGERLLQRGQQRPDAVHAGARPGQRAAGGAVHVASPGGGAAAGADRGGGGDARTCPRVSAARWPPSR